MIPRESIRGLQAGAHGASLRDLAIGAGVGAGAIAGAALARGSDLSGGIAALAGLFGAGVGLLAGWLIGRTACWCMMQAPAAHR